MELDKPNALPLPQHPFEFAQWETNRVGINYHIKFDDHFYSVPYPLIHQELDMRGTLTTVEFFKNGRRILAHPRSYQKDPYITRPEHMPPSHQKYVEWTPERILRWAAKYGPSVKDLIEQLMAARAFPEQAYRSSLGIIRLERRYGARRLENACNRALRYRNLTYKGVKNILEKGLDKIQELPAAVPAIRHENLRGPQYYQSHHQTTGG